MKAKVEFEFASAHFLPNYAGKCKNLHGHNYTLLVTVQGRPNPATGMLLDFHDVEGAVQPVLEIVDHRLLNEIEGLSNPTAENLVRWLWHRIRPSLAGLVELELFEMARYSIVYRGEE